MSNCLNNMNIAIIGCGLIGKKRAENIPEGHKLVAICDTDKNNADKAATDSMRNEINKLHINGEVVIGEGELDEAPMLFIGEKLGTGGNLNLDIAYNKFIDLLKNENKRITLMINLQSLIRINANKTMFNLIKNELNS